MGVYMYTFNFTFKMVLERENAPFQKRNCPKTEMSHFSLPQNPQNGTAERYNSAEYRYVRPLVISG